MQNLDDIRYVHRIRVGSSDPEKPASDQQCAEAMALINRCLSDHPKGRVIALEKSASVMTIGEHHVVIEAVTYHIGFSRRPMWFNE